MSLSFDPPPMSVSMPKGIDWHMISDHDLTRLTRPEMGFVGPLGFVGLGAALDLSPQLMSVFEKAYSKPPLPILVSDLVCVGDFFGSIVLTIICLGLAGILWWQNKGLAGEIHSRTKHALSYPIPVDDSHTA